MFDTIVLLMAWTLVVIVSGLSPPARSLVPASMITSCGLCFATLVSMFMRPSSACTFRPAERTFKFYAMSVGVKLGVLCARCCFKSETKLWPITTTVSTDMIRL